MEPRILSPRRGLRHIGAILVVMLLWTLGACASEDTPAASSIDPTPQIPPVLAGTEVEKISGTVRKVTGLEFYRNSSDNYELAFRPLAGAGMYVIVPDYDESLELVPVELIDFLRIQVASKTANQDELGIPSFLTVSSLPESHAKEGLRVVFSGSVGSNPLALQELNRVPMRLSDIEVASGP